MLWQMKISKNDNKNIKYSTLIILFIYIMLYNVRMYLQLIINLLNLGVKNFKLSLRYNIPNIL